MPTIYNGKSNVIGNISNTLRTQVNSVVSTMTGSTTGVNNIPEYNQVQLESAISTRRNTQFREKLQ